MYENQKLKVQINIYIPMEIRERLQVIAAKRMIQNPQKNFTAAGVVAEFITANILTIEQEAVS